MFLTVFENGRVKGHDHFYQCRGMKMPSTRSTRTCRGISWKEEVRNGRNISIFLAVLEAKYFQQCRNRNISSIVGSAKFSDS